MPTPRSLLLTRPRDQAEDFAAGLSAALPGRFRPVFAPVLGIEPVPAEIDLTGAQGLVFTSANGVAVFAALEADRLLPAFCVGEMTARAARAAGFEAEAAAGDVAALARLVAGAARPDGGPFLHVRGRHAAGDLIGRLAVLGVPARPLEIYDQVPREVAGAAAALLAAGAIDVLTAFSPRSAGLFACQAHARGWDLSRSTLVALSPAADAAHGLPEPGRRVVAGAPTREAMIAALVRL